MTHATVYAVIPCGGRGTRMHWLTGGQPKELMEIAGAPLVEHVARECASSGITDLLIVIAPGKEAIEAHFAKIPREQALPCRITFAVQPKPRGVADAIRLGRAFARDGPIAVALPDNLFVDDQPALRRVIAVAQSTGKSTVAVVGITALQAATHGATTIYNGEPIPDTDEYRITGIPNKNTKSTTFDTAGAAIAYTGVGRFAFEAAVWDAIGDVEETLPAGYELDDVPVMQLLLE